MREWQRRQPIIPRIGNLTAYDIDIPNSYFARDIPVPLQLVPLIRRSPVCQSPSSLVHSGGICSYEHEFACTNPLSPSTSPVPANELTPLLLRLTIPRPCVCHHHQHQHPRPHQQQPPHRHLHLHRHHRQ